jgi:hypothetical protein
MGKDVRPKVTGAKAPEYRLVSGHKGYRVGSDGSVWTQWKQVGLMGLWRAFGAWQRLCPTRCKQTGYTKVPLRGSTDRVKTWPVGALVLTMFQGERPPGTKCLHNDGNNTNNALSNLRWGTVTKKRTK